MQQGLYSQIVYLVFSQDAVSRPVVCSLSRQFGLEFNILKAQITPRQEGNMTVELIGSEESFAKGMDFLRESGVKVVPAAQRISRDEDSCLHCGMCISLCPTRALKLDPDTRLVEFHSGKCSTCGLCVQLCPVGAMQALIDNGADENGEAGEDA